MSTLRLVLTNTARSLPACMVALAAAFLLAASQDLDTVVVFKIDPNTGALSPTGQSVVVPKPVCLKFWQSPE